MNNKRKAAAILANELTRLDRLAGCKRDELEIIEVTVGFVDGVISEAARKARKRRK